ncbi:TPA: EpsG family protein [Proteus mirabilis]|nr:EpsG family protein [Proteus mirabilis]ELL8907115.1 EpsG family protein [Proteus mirabilis]MBB6620102.1 EpsG family protein [Proteus mirabilis]MBG2852033.1 EpsG family protein [Proteus mirabilis]MBL1399514.1 EpsG family protein [Proteus mirabilis]MBN4087070.1 EpsG family protein [Proteus mirabilis]
MIFTYIVYNSILLFSFLFSYIAEYCKNKKLSIIFLSGSFFIIFFIAAIRYNIGTDYKNYVEIFKNLNTSDQYLELSFLFISSTIKSNGLDVQWLFVVFSFISLLFIYITAFNYNKVLFIISFILILYLQNLSAIRQICAICISFYAIHKLMNNRSMSFVLWILISSTFHSSTLILLPFALLKKIRCNNFLFFIITLIISVLIFQFDLASKILSIEFISQTKYANYINGKFSSETKLGSGFGVILKVIYPFIILLFTMNRKDKSSNYIFTFMMMYIISIFLSAKIHIFNRIPPIFSVIIPFSVCYVYNIRTKYKQLIIFSFISIYLFLYEVDINISQSSLNSGLGISPYTTIFEK